MKKIALLALFLCLAFSGFSQSPVKLGLRFAPNISFNSVNGEGRANNVSNDGAAVRFSAGPIADFFFADNYAFSTGLWYTVKRAAIAGSLNGDVGFTEPANSLYNLQYLQVPLSIKLYTNEVAPDLRVYFQLGGTMDFKIAEKHKDEATNFLYMNKGNKSAFKPIDAGILLGAGAELIMGESTAVFGGLNYNRGLVNSVGGVEFAGSKINNDLAIRNSYFSLEVGIKF